MMKRQWIRSAVLAAVVAAGCLGMVQRASSATLHGPCPPPVRCQVMVPQIVTETRTVLVTKFRHERREKTVAVTKLVPRHETVTREFTFMVPAVQTKTVEFQVRKPVFTEVPVTYTVMVPEKVEKTATRKVCKVVPVQKTRTVVVDQGHWETFQVPVCGTVCPTGCCAVRTCKRWVSQPVEKEVSFVSYQTVWEDRPFTYHMTVMRPEQRTRTVQKCDFVLEPRTKEVHYTVCVPEQRTKTFDVVRYDRVPTEKTLRYTVCVPYQVEKEIQVRRCIWVPKPVHVSQRTGEPGGTMLAALGGAGSLAEKR